MTTHPALQILLEEHWRSCCCPKIQSVPLASNTDRKPESNESNSNSQKSDKVKENQVHTPTVIQAACCSFPPLFPLRDPKLMPVCGTLRDRVPRLSWRKWNWITSRYTFQNKPKEQRGAESSMSVSVRGRQHTENNENYPKEPLKTVKLGIKKDFNQSTTPSPLMTVKGSNNSFGKSHLIVGFRCLYFEGLIPELPVSVVWTSSDLMKPDGKFVSWECQCSSSNEHKYHTNTHIHTHTHKCITSILSLGTTY